MATQHFCHFLKERGRDHFKNDPLGSHHLGSKAEFDKYYGGNKMFDMHYKPQKHSAFARPVPPQTAAPKGRQFANRPTVTYPRYSPGQLNAVLQHILNRAMQEEMLRRAAAAAYVQAQTRAQEVAKPVIKSAPTGWWTTLGVAQNASTDQIKAAYRNMAKATHPDTSPTGSAEAFRSVHEAYKKGISGK